jgi:hypothetical protein
VSSCRGVGVDTREVQCVDVVARCGVEVVGEVGSLECVGYWLGAKPPNVGDLVVARAGEKHDHHDHLVGYADLAALVGHALTVLEDVAELNAGLCVAALGALHDPERADAGQVPLPSWPLKGCFGRPQ